MVDISATVNIESLQYNHVIRDYPQLTGYFTLPLSSDRICYRYAELAKVPASADHPVRTQLPDCCIMPDYLRYIDRNYDDIA